jgi:hypothetical protein
MIYRMERELRKEIFDYKGSRNDPELPRIPSKPVFGTW